jgi:ribose/xylose/arabinose/galactoside ABC-type transport system permease subunit
MLAGAAWGAVNGFLIAKARIPALIVTLGMMGMLLGLALLIARSANPLISLAHPLLSAWRVGGQRHQRWV